MPDKYLTPPPFPNDLFWKNGLNLYDADPFGSYTGLPKDEKEQPVQDADDL